MAAKMTPPLCSPPSMPPPPYFKPHFIDPSTFKSAINSKLDNPLLSLFNLSVRVLQLIFALASGISYAIELANRRQGLEISTFVFAQVVFGATLVALIIDGSTVRYYRISWIADWVLSIFWFALFGSFYKVYLSNGIEPGYIEVDVGRMKRAVWCDLINALLWLGSALFSTAMCCSGITASISCKLKKRKQKKEEQKMMEKSGELELGTLRG